MNKDNHLIFEAYQSFKKFVSEKRQSGSTKIDTSKVSQALDSLEGNTQDLRKAVNDIMGKGTVAPTTPTTPSASTTPAVPAASTTPAAPAASTAAEPATPTNSSPSASSSASTTPAAPEQSIEDRLAAADEAGAKAAQDIATQQDKLVAADKAGAAAAQAIAQNYPAGTPTPAAPVQPQVAAAPQQPQPQKPVATQFDPRAQRTVMTTKGLRPNFRYNPYKIA